MNNQESRVRGQDGFIRARSKSSKRKRFQEKILQPVVSAVVKITLISQKNPLKTQILNTLNMIK